MFGGRLQGFGGAAHLAGPAEGRGDGDEQKRRQRHGGGEQRQLLQVEADQALGPEIAPEIGAPHPDPESRQDGGEGEGGRRQNGTVRAAGRATESHARRLLERSAGCNITG